jgi:predicted O-methyltransferase YrrM
MNPILAEILRTRDKLACESGILPEEGEFLQNIVMKIRPKISLEIGFAYGISALFICEALQKVKGEKHIVVDPNPYAYNGIGIKNIRKARYDALIEFIEAPSEMGLPDLLKKGTRIDFAFVDGWHSFDHALVDFFYINLMLNVKGVIAFDDADWPSIDKVCRYVSRYPCYKTYASWPVRRNSGALKITSKTLEHVATRQMKFLRDDLSISQRRCVAFRKVKEDDRSAGWYAEF